MSRKQLEILFSKKCAPETGYLDTLLENYKTKKRVSTILNMKKMFLSITEITHKATKDKLVK